MISEHVSYREATHSATATRKDLDNTPNEEQIKNMKVVAEKLFEPLREWIGGPVKINSFFRGLPLNTAIGGAKSSQHMKGQAIDIDDTYGHRSNASMFQHIRYNMDYDQIIWEFGDDKNPAWVHISYVSEEKNRHRCLKAVKKDGKTHYELM